MKTRKILITGAAGFLGFHLASKLQSDPANTLVLVDNFRRGAQDRELKLLIANPNVKWVSGDLMDESLYPKLGEGFDEVYHLAAVIGVRNVLEKPHEVVKINAMSTILLLDWFTSGGGEKILFSSTSEAYAWTQKFYPLPIPTPEDVPLSLTHLSNPRSSYAGSKIFGELAIVQFCQMFNKKYVIVRYHNVYGPRMGYDHVVPQLCERIMRGEKPLVVYSPHHKRAFCYVKDAMAATILAMRKEEAINQIFNIGNDLEEIEILELAKMLLQKVGRKVSLQSQDASHDPIERRCPDITKARQLLGYEPTVLLAQGLEKTLAWYQK